MYAVLPAGHSATGTSRRGLAVAPGAAGRPSSPGLRRRRASAPGAGERPRRRGRATPPRRGRGRSTAPAAADAPGSGVAARRVTASAPARPARRRRRARGRRARGRPRRAPSTAPTIAIGARQRGRAGDLGASTAAPQFRHQSWSGRSGAPQRGQARGSGSGGAGRGGSRALDRAHARRSPGRTGCLGPAVGARSRSAADAVLGGGLGGGGASCSCRRRVGAASCVGVRLAARRRPPAPRSSPGAPRSSAASGGGRRSRFGRLSLAAARRALPGLEPAARAAGDAASRTPSRSARRSRTARRRSGTCRRCRARAATMPGRSLEHALERRGARRSTRPAARACRARAPAGAASVVAVCGRCGGSRSTRPPRSRSSTSRTRRRWRRPPAQAAAPLGGRALADELVEVDARGQGAAGSTSGASRGSPRGRAARVGGRRLGRATAGSGPGCRRRRRAHVGCVGQAAHAARGDQRLERPSIGRGCLRASRRATTSRQAATTRAAMRSDGEQLRPRATVRRAGPGPRAAAPAARASGRGRTARSNAPGDAGERDRVDADRRRRTPGTPQASASITARPNPSSWDGTRTALAALIQYGTSLRRRRRPIVSSRCVAARPPCARSNALERPRRVVGEEQVGPVGVEPEAARAPRRAGWAGSASRSMPTGSTATRRVVPAPGTLALNARETAAGSATNGSAARVMRFERGWKRSLPCSVTTTGPEPRERGRARRSGRSARGRRRSAVRGAR